uniref:Uncharacterized protein n=1 Tax=Panagrolaimus sp. JU765 TaxID=591449 RepID=A0AC34Q7P5_9BILA
MLQKSLDVIHVVFQHLKKDQLIQLQEKVYGQPEANSDSIFEAQLEDIVGNILDVQMKTDPGWHIGDKVTIFGKYKDDEHSIVFHMQENADEKEDDQNMSSLTLDDKEKDKQIEE